MPTIQDRDDLAGEYQTLLDTKVETVSETQSRAGKLAAIARKIGDVEVDLYADGVKFSPWVKPSTGVRSSRQDKSESELRESLARAFTVQSDPNAPDSVRSHADARITRILRAAEVRDYQIADPRKSAKTAK